MVISSVKHSAEYLWKQMHVVAKKVDKKTALKLVSQHKSPILACFVVLCLAYLAKRILNDKGYSVIDLTTGALSTVAGFTSKKASVVVGAVLILAKPVLDPAAKFVEPYTDGLFRLLFPGLANFGIFDGLGKDMTNIHSDEPAKQDESRSDQSEIARKLNTTSTLVLNPEQMAIKRNFQQALKELTKPQVPKPDVSEVTQKIDAISTLVLNPEQMAIEKNVQQALKDLRDIAPRLNPNQMEGAQTLFGTLLTAVIPTFTGPVLYEVSNTDDSIIEVPDDGNCGFHSWLVGLKGQSENLVGSVLEPTHSSPEIALPMLRNEAVKKERELFATDEVFKNLLIDSILNDQFHTMFKFFEESANAQMAATFDDSVSFEDVFKRNFDEAQGKMTKPFDDLEHARGYFTDFEESLTAFESGLGRDLYLIKVQTLCEKLLSRETLTATETERYFIKMGQEGVWAQLPEHYALAECYGLPVCIVVKPSEHDDWPQEREKIMQDAMEGQEVSGQYTFIFNKEAATGEKPKPWIFIEQINGNHFNAVIQNGSNH